MTIKKDITSTDIITFWFHEITPEQWWQKSAEFDNEVKTRFLNIYKKAAVNELVKWRSKPLSSLAEIIILDQFPRNIFRDKKQSFATDPLALCLTQNAIDKGFDQELTPEQKAFLYMPLMHSESAQIHKDAEIIYSAPEMNNYLNFELQHKAIIDRFGRYPHRNKILGRRMKKAELEFLKEPNSSF